MISPLGSAMNPNGAPISRRNSACLDSLSADMARIWACWLANSSYRSRYDLSSRVQPGVNALGKNARITGPFATISDNRCSFPSVSLAVKSGAVSPTLGVLMQRPYHTMGPCHESPCPICRRPFFSSWTCSCCPGPGYREWHSTPPEWCCRTDMNIQKSSPARAWSSAAPGRS